MDIWKNITEIFQAVFDDENIELSETTNANDIEDWDSIAQILLIVAIEKEFNIKFTLEEITGLKNVGETVALIESKTS